MKLDIDFVNASAGSGKTHELMERMSKMVCPENASEQAIPAGKILATTFTEKAAAELRSRVREKLLEGGHIEEAQGVFGGLIGTVNGICGRLVEEHAFELGLPPGLQVIPSSDDPEAQDYAEIIFARAADSVFARYEDAVGPLVDRFDLSPESADDEGASWKTLARKLAEGLRCNDIAPRSAAFQKSVEMSLARAGEIFPGTDGTGVLSAVVDALGAVKPAMLRILDPRRADGIKYSALFLNLVRVMLELERAPSWRGVYQLKNDRRVGGSELPKSPGQSAAAKASADGCAVYDLFLKLRNSDGIIPANFMKDPEIRADAEKMVRILFEVAGECMEAYQKYKADFGLIDFVDQETLALKLFREHGAGAFGRAFKECVRAIMVDEFQDTSPLQLALFLEMHKLVPNVTFVGDPKQAIYEFRGTDPSLMMRVAERVKRDGLGQFTPLKNSWRSKERLVDFANAVFAPVFKPLGMDGEDVELSLPAERRGKPEWTGGELEAWTLRGARCGAAAASAIAESVVAFVGREGGREHRLNDIAVLGRSRRALKEIAEALSARGVPASLGSDKLMDQLECNLAMAAYRYAVNPADTVALAVLAAHLVEPRDWLRKLAESSSGAAARWAEDPRIRSLGSVGDRTAAEMLDHAIGAIGLDAHVGGMPDGDRRLRNLTALRDLCTRYMQESSFGGCSATPVGFIAYARFANAKCASAEGGDCVQLLTYHKAKGLEWPTVVLTELDRLPHASAFAQKVVMTEALDIEDPLNGRCVCVVPNPLGNKIANLPGEKNQKPVLDYLDGSVGYRMLAKEAEAMGYAELGRLMYVGVTRAVERLVFAVPYDDEGFACRWLDRMSGEISFDWKTADFDLTIGKKEFPFKVFDHAEDDPSLTLDFSRHRHEDSCGRGDAARVRACLPPSGEEGKDVAVSVANVETIGKPFATATNEDESAALGDAMHGYYAVAVPGDDDPALAAAFLERWNVRRGEEDAKILAECVVESGVNLRRYLSEKWPGAEIHTEVPMTLVNELGQQYQGFIDMLVETDGGYVLIDHKTTSRGDYGALARLYAGQLAVYKQAVERASGKKVVATVLHLPVRGVCLECEL